MTRSISAGLQAHIAGELTTLATCWKMTRRDGRTFTFTDHDQDLLFDGDTYTAASSYNRTAIQSKSDLSPDSLDVIGILDSAEITETDIRAGLFDFAEVRIFMVNWEDLAQGALKLRRGRLGEVSLRGGRFTAELRGLTQAYSQHIVELYQPECRADLGDGRCRIPISPPFLGRNQTLPKSVQRDDRFAVDTSLDGQSVDPSDPSWQTTEDLVWKVITAGTTAATQPAYAGATAGTQVTDGTAVLEAEAAFKRFATVAGVTDNRVFEISVTEPRAVDGWFAFGAVAWESGANAGLVMEVKGWTQATGEVELFLAMPFAVQVGDTLTVYAGCDKQLSTCIGRFDNAVNFRGEPFVPGQDEYLTVPDFRG